MNADQIVWARAVAEESYDGQLIRDLCNALDRLQGALHEAYEEGWDSGVVYGHCIKGDLHQKRSENPYGRAA